MAGLHLELIRYNQMLMDVAQMCCVQARQLAVAGDYDIVFHPSGGIIQCLHRLTGQPIGTLRGHLDTVNCCCYNSYQQELYSGGNDCNIVVWAAPAAPDKIEGPDSKDDQDAWSD